MACLKARTTCVGEVNAICHVLSPWLPIGRKCRERVTWRRLAVQQLGTASDDEAKSRNALDALVGTADEEVYAQFVYIEGNTAEAAHGVYNQFLAVHLDEVGYLLEGIEHAGSGFAMHHAT